MFGKWIIELSEMTALKWADANALKAFLSRSTDIARLSYAETSKDYPRQSVFIGTINPEHMGYLNDSTGNRRYWIVSTPCTKDNQIDVMGLEMVCDQLWAEAYACYQKEPLYLQGEAEKIQQMMTEARMPEEPYVRTIEKVVEDNPDTNEVQTQDILEYMGVSMKGQTRLDMSRVAAAFEKLGWERTNRRERGRNEIWFVKPLEDRIKRETERLEEAPV
jgi:predicted P-loop ATPase